MIPETAQQSHGKAWLRRAYVAIVPLAEPADEEHVQDITIQFIKRRNHG